MTDVIEFLAVDSWRVPAFAVAMFAFALLSTRHVLASILLSLAITGLFVGLNVALPDSPRKARILQVLWPALVLLMVMYGVWTQRLRADQE